MNCTRCEGTGFLNLHQIDEIDPAAEVDEMDQDQILLWIKRNKDHDVSVCDCCGDGEVWYGEPGRHYTGDDPTGDRGPYAYNGGLCECH